MERCDAIGRMNPSLDTAPATAPPSPNASEEQQDRASSRPAVDNQPLDDPQDLDVCRKDR
jgi:hypothetical protein